MPQPHWEIRLGKGNQDQPDMRRVQIFSVEMGVEIVLAGTVEHVSSLVFLLMDTWIAQHAPALAEELINQMAAMDFFDANKIITEFIH